MSLVAASVACAAVLLLLGSGSRSRLEVAQPRSAPTVAAVAGGTGAATVCLAAGASATTVVAVAAIVAGTAAVLRRRQQRRRRLERSGEVVALTRALAAEIRAGRPPGAALLTAAAAAPSITTWLHAAARAADLGADVGAELRRVAEVDGCRRLSAVASAWAVMAGAGARTADVLDDVAGAVEADDELRDELDAMLAGPRATVVVLALLPVAAVAFASAAGARPLQVLVHTALGHGLLLAASVLDLAGVMWIRAVARRAVAAAA